MTDITPHLIYIIIVITLGASFQFGYHAGVINSSEAAIQQFISDVFVSRNYTSESLKQTIFPLVVAAYPVGGIIGAFVGSDVSNKWGRKLGLIIFDVNAALASVLMILSKTFECFEVLIIGRFLVGISCGAFTGIGPTYLSEVCPLKFRGFSGVMNQFVIVFAIFVSQLLGMNEMMGNDLLWPYLLGLSLIPCLLQMLLLSVCPESPKYLFLTKRDNEGTKKAIVWLRGENYNINSEIVEMERENIEASGERLLIRDIFSRRHLRLAIMVAILAQLAQQLSGTTALVNYSTSLFRSTGMASYTSTLLTLGISLTNVFVTVVSAFIIDKLGRRPLLLTGIIGMLTTSTLFTICLVGRSHITNASWLVYPAIVSIFLFIVAFAIGPGSIPWFVVAEMFIQEARDSAVAIAVFVNWSGQIALGLGYPYLMIYLGDYSFMPFIVCMVFILIGIYRYLPETKGRTPEQVESEFRRRAGDNVLSAQNSQHSQGTDGSGSPLFN